MTSDSIHPSRFSSEEVFARVFHASPAALSLSTLDDGCYLEVNDSFLRETGFTRDEVIGHRSVELGLWVVDGDRDRIVEALRERGTVNDCEIVIRTKSGERRWLLAFFELIEVAGQTCIFSLFHDVTERRQTQDVLQKLSSVVEQTADNVFITNHAGAIEYVNAAFEQLTGYSRDEAIGQTPRLLKSGRHDEAFYHTLWQTILAGQTFRGILVNRKKNGELYDEEKTITPLRNAQGVITHFVSTGKDITEYRRAEAALREREQHLKLVLNVTADAVYDWDVRVGLTRWNHGLQSLFGYPGDELRAHAWWRQRIHPDDLPRVAASLDGTIEQRASFWSCEYRYRRADDSYAHVIDRGHFMFDEAGQPTRMVGVMVDITDRVQLAEAHVHAVMEERRRLARDLHDSVTQSLYSLTLLAEAARRLAKAGDLERVEGQVARLGETAQQALKEMRLLVYELRPQPLEQEGLIGALQQRLDAVEKRSGVNARLLVEKTDRLPEPIEATLYFIAQEALNNSLKHSGATSVTVKLSGEPQQVRLEVIDNGRGFERTAITDRGGLGLTSMHERAERLGGALTIESTPDQGTRLCADIHWQEEER